MSGTDTEAGASPESAQAATGAVVLKFLRAHAVWAVIAVPFVVHIVVAVQNLRYGQQRVVPEFSDVSGAGLTVVLRTFGELFVRPETWQEMARLYALWTVIFLVLAIYRAVKSESNILYGVTLFLSHGLAAVLILAVITPSLWVLLRGVGPVAVDLAPPLVMLFIGVLLTIAARNASS